LALLFAVVYFSDSVAADFYASLLVCTQEHDDSRRLACFDREMAAIPRPQESERKQSQQSLAEFGLSETQKKNVAKPQQVTDRVAAVTQQPDGALVVSLENGQVWKAVERDYFPVRAGDSVTIYAGALGSFWLSFAAGSNRTVRVNRLKP